MKGMSRITGKYLNDLDHLKQSIVDILSTPIGSRVMKREYGSRLFDLVDKPINKELFPQIYAAIADALQKWEPRLKLEKITITEIKDSHISVSLNGVYLLNEQKITLEGVVI
ncbi:baseplate assembly protein [Alphaproteobacteria bacterium]|nr:baseplate assembly protein [Alphaproteobacteria bacterium]